MTIAPLDWAVLVVYLIVITGIGLVAGYRVRQQRRLLPRRAPVRPVADDRPELQRRHARRDAGGARRRGLQPRRVRDLVSVEEPLHHAVLLDHGAGLPPHPADDDGGVHRGSVRTRGWARSTSSSPLCFFIINTGSMLKGAGKVISQATGARHRRQRDRRRHDRDVHPLQLRRRPGGRRPGPISSRVS